MSRPRFTRYALLGSLLAVWATAGDARPAAAQAPVGGTIIQDISTPSERLDLFLNSSKMIRLQRPIPKAMVQNPEIADLYPRGQNQIQVIAKKAGFTNIVLWDTENKMYTIDLLVTADGRELHTYLKRQFPRASLRVTPLNNKVVIEGSVDDPSHVSKIVEIARDFYPAVIDRITVGGVQQVLLHVKVMEVSRTKLRRLGIDWGLISGNEFTVQSVSGLLSGLGTQTSPISVNSSNTFVFGIVNPNSAFTAAFDALRQNNVTKVLAEPNLVTVSGRPAYFRSGGEFPIFIATEDTVNVSFKQFGTRIDFVPIVLANGHIRLEVRPHVSELDFSSGVSLGGVSIPGLRTREVDTAVELRAGQTLAIAGLVQTRHEAVRTGLPWISDLPWIGVPFRRTENQENEVETLIMVTPEIVHGMECHEVPPGGPGTSTTNPSDIELGFQGYIEVPKCCGPEHAIPVGPDYGGHGMPGQIVPEHGFEGGHPGMPIEGHFVPTPHVPQGGAVVPEGHGMPGGMAPMTPKQGEPSVGRDPRRGLPRSAVAPRPSVRPVIHNQPVQPSQPSQPSQPLGTTQPAVPQPRPWNSAAPGFIGPHGYDVKN